MRISFENWIEENNIPSNAKELFNESVLCYKLQAYRSSFLMSYIALQNVLRDRILNATYKPTRIPDSLWERTAKDLRNEDMWDNTIFDAVKRKDPDRIFLVTDSIITQYEAWRTIRNDCAHGKTGKIFHFHIEAFWNFIQVNYTKFMINGGKTGIIDIIERHYNTSITPPGKDVSYIIKNIELGITDDELQDFFAELLSYCDTNFSFKEYFDDRYPVQDLWNGIFNCSETRIHDALIKFIKTKGTCMLGELIERYPTSVNELISDSDFSRKLWKEKIFEFKSWQKCFWVLLKNIVNQNLIPEGEQDEFNKAIYKKIRMSYSKEHIAILKEIGYFERLHRTLFDSSQYTYPGGIEHANWVSDIFITYIGDLGLDIDIVKCINCIFSFATYGKFVTAIKELMKQEKILMEYENLVTSSGLMNYKEKFIE